MLFSCFRRCLELCAAIVHTVHIGTDRFKCRLNMIELLNHLSPRDILGHRIAARGVVLAIPATALQDLARS